MKGLIKITVAVIVIIAIGFGASALVTIDLDGRLNATAERGLDEGLAHGSEAGWQEAIRDGYQEGSRTGYETAIGEDRDYLSDDGFYFLYNPTSDEVQEILAKDTTGSARSINNFAEVHGIRAAYVRCRVVTTDGEGKIYIFGLLGFETVDKGFIFFDPFSHREVKLEIGRRYSELNTLTALQYDGIISSVRIIW